MAEWSEFVTYSIDLSMYLMKSSWLLGPFSAFILIIYFWSLSSKSSNWGNSSSRWNKHCERNAYNTYKSYQRDFHIRSRWYCYIGLFLRLSPSFLAATDTQNTPLQQAYYSLGLSQDTCTFLLLENHHLLIADLANPLFLLWNGLQRRVQTLQMVRIVASVAKKHFGL